MEISDKGLHFIMAHEGVRLAAYDDGTGVWTIGVGHIRGVQQGDTCTMDQAMAWLREDAAQSVADVNRLVTVPL
ncbi:lysozyme, partial [Staphylococcus aureus]